MRQLNRKYVGFEINKDYIKLTNKWLAIQYGEIELNAEIQSNF
jgi:hypothetical protein